MIASYYIVHSEEYIDYNFHIYKKKATLYQHATKTQKESEEGKKKSKLLILITWIISKRVSNVILIFYALISIFLIMDNRDIFVPLIFGLLVATAPIHMYLLASSSPEDTKIRLIYLFYIPIFISCIGMVLFRYLLFFQK
jgi:hypothetical protein